jgi:hypothetical protein
MKGSLTIDHGGREPFVPKGSPEEKARRLAEYLMASEQTRLMREAAILERYADTCFCSDCFMGHDNTDCPHRPYLTNPTKW